MSETFFQDFKRDDGSPVTVEYSYAPGSETTYSPHSGADSGDPCEVHIMGWWPNVQEYHDLHSRKIDLENFMAGKSISWLCGADGLREELEEIGSDIHRYDEQCILTEAEIGRMEEWIAEHHVYEPSEQDYF